MVETRFAFRVLVIFLLAFAHSIAILSDDEKTADPEELDSPRGQKGKKLLSPQRKMASIQRNALVSWTAILTPDDVTPEGWKKTIGSHPPAIFDHYLLQMSNLFKRHGATINFVSVGACDGTNDRTITRFFELKHFSGLFIEPMSNNFADLKKQIEVHNAVGRSFALKAAASNNCPSDTLKVERPIYEKKNPNAPHWLRRQIGAVLKNQNANKSRDNDWIIEEVLCITGKRAIEEWQQNDKQLRVGSSQASDKKLPPTPRRRPHILKVDVEGHDFEVISSFIDTKEIADLPLLVCYEAKSLKNKHDRLMELLNKRGYIFLNGADGVAMLLPDRALPPQRKAGRRKKRKGRHSKE